MLYTLIIGISMIKQGKIMLKPWLNKGKIGYIKNLKLLKPEI